MDLANAFKIGGWGMWPTLFCGVLLVGIGIVYAIRPQKRYVPLLLAIGTMTLFSGILGFSTGVINSFMYIHKVAATERYIALIGVAESLYNVVFAFIFLMLAAILGAVGAARLAGVLPPRAGSVPHQRPA
jgi:hypothetical protein